METQHHPHTRVYSRDRVRLVLSAQLLPHLRKLFRRGAADHHVGAGRHLVHHQRAIKLRRELARVPCSGEFESCPWGIVTNVTDTTKIGDGSTSPHEPDPAADPAAIDISRDDPEYAARGDPAVRGHLRGVVLHYELDLDPQSVLHVRVPICVLWHHGPSPFHIYIFTHSDQVDR